MNTPLARSFLEKAQLRLKRIAKEAVEPDEASIVFEEVYESLRESAQALMEIKGYKPYSHEALISFLKEERLLSLDTITVLDNYRIIRNNSVYRAEKVSLQKCREALKFAQVTIPKIRHIFEKLALGL